jgi:SAM-dependent methyltransferase
MNKDYEQKYHCLEDTYWWCKARRDMILQLLNKEPRRARIIDLGCSGGTLIKKLEENGFTNVEGIDISKVAIQACVRKNISQAKLMDANKLSFKDNTFDIIIASDILEHLQNDSEALRSWYRKLKPKGKLILFVPAFDWMWSSQDDVNNHFRRYSKKSLLVPLKESGFSIERLSYWNSILFIPITISRLIQKKFFVKNKLCDQFYKLPITLNYLLYCLLKIENCLSRYVNLPIGISLFAVTKKR